MQHHTAISTEWIITAGIADELAATAHADVVLADRAAPDALAYYTAALELRGAEPAPDTLERLHLLVTTQIPQRGPDALAGRSGRRSD
jgi:CO/xanthine dehydrogenase Mo-binding subunit